MNGPPTLRRRRALVLALAVLGLAACRRGPRLAALPSGATVLALGDSITFGTGAPADGSYPAALARLTGWQVVNAGVPGHVSAQALERLPGLLQAHAPSLLLLSIGGNDLLRRLPEAELRAHIRQMVALARDAGTEVVLIAVPRPSVAGAVTGLLSDHPLYAELADELTLPLHAGGWSRVLGDAGLRSDAIHANAAGYETFARGLADTLRSLGLLGP